MMPLPSKPRALGLLSVLCLCLGLPGSASADDDKGGAQGRFGILIAGRSNLGDLGARYGTGLLFGVYAGIDSSIGDSPWGIGLGLTTLVRGFYFASDDDLVDQTISVTEASFGLRMRRRLGLAPRFLSLSGGGAINATNLPIPPSNERTYFGGYGGIGYEMHVFGEWSAGSELRYFKYAGGSENVTLLLSFIAGIR